MASTFDSSSTPSRRQPATPMERISRFNQSVGSELNRVLTRAGFETSEPVHETHSCFTIEEALASLTTSTYSKPVTVELAEEDRSVVLPVVVTRAEAIYSRFGEPGDSPAGAWEHPGWCFEGWVMKSGFDTFSDFVRVRFYMLWSDDLIFWQVASDGSKKNEELRWA